MVCGMVSLFLMVHNDLGSLHPFAFFHNISFCFMVVAGTVPGRNWLNATLSCKKHSFFFNDAANVFLKYFMLCPIHFGSKK